MTMQDTLASQELSQLDLSKVAALQQKRTLAFVNHFVVTTVQFLNNFMKKSEQKLMEFERKLEKVEAAMVLLEARLSSIPEINNSTESKSGGTEAIAMQSQDQANNPNTQEPESQTEESQTETQNTSEPSHPEYDRFVKMVQVGVPIEAVKLKVSLEGLDPVTFTKIMANK